MVWKNLFLHEGYGRGRRHRPLTVEVNDDALLLHWDDGEKAVIPLERISWVSEDQEVYGDELSYLPSFVTVHYETEGSGMSTLTIGCWRSAHDLVVSIIRMREEKLARLTNLAGVTY